VPVASLTRTGAAPVAAARAAAVVTAWEEEGDPSVPATTVRYADAKCPAGGDKSLISGLSLDALYNC
jgi:hypothetical protein